MKAWMATYNEVKGWWVGYEEGMAADEAARLESEALASLDRVEVWQLIEATSKKEAK